MSVISLKIMNTTILQSMSIDSEILPQRFKEMEFNYFIFKTDMVEHHLFMMEEDVAWKQNFKAIFADFPPPYIKE